VIGDLKPYAEYKEPGLSWLDPVPTDGGGRKPEPELDRLSNILKTFNDNFGTLFADTDRVAQRIRDDIAPKVAADKAFQNARDNTPHTARMAHDQALGKVMQILLKDDTQVYKQFVENESFRRFVDDRVYQLTSGAKQGRRDLRWCCRRAAIRPAGLLLVAGNPLQSLAVASSLAIQPAALRPLASEMPCACLVVPPWPSPPPWRVSRPPRCRPRPS
jgi:hypothetical protein